MAKKTNNTATEEPPGQIKIDILTDSIFRQAVTDNLRELKKARDERPEPAQGFHYRRDWYDQLDDMDALNTDFFVTNVAELWQKKSNLSSNLRPVLLAVCEKALETAVLHYSTRTEKV